MTTPPLVAETSPLAKNDRESSFLPLLFVLTVVTGLVDAVSYLKLGHVFVANMTGNIVFLGFAIAGAKDFSASASLVAIAAFMLGALAGGRLGSRMAAQHHRFFAIAILVKLGLVGAAWSLDYSVPDGDLLQYGLIVLLALAMGLQNSTARVLAVADLTTTVLTLTLTGLAADSALAGGTSPRRNRRLLAIGAMFLGATIGALLALRAGTGSVLAVVFTLLSLNAIWAYRIWSRATA